MKGFLIKDYRQLIAQKNLLIILPIGLIFMFTNETPVFGISYILYVITFLSNSLIAYDTFDNGMPFLMTLPGGRKAYVNEKYLFNAMNSSITALILAPIASILELSRGHGILAVKELFFGTLLLYMTALMFSAVMLPIQLKYGHEKSRIVLMIMFGIIFLGSMGVMKLAETFQIDVDGMFELLNQLSFRAVAVGFFILLIMIMTISWHISQNIMKKKSF